MVLTVGMANTPRSRVQHAKGNTSRCTRVGTTRHILPWGPGPGAVAATQDPAPVVAPRDSSCFPTDASGKFRTPGGPGTSWPQGGYPAPRKRARRAFCREMSVRFGFAGPPRHLWGIPSLPDGEEEEEDAPRGSWEAPPPSSRTSVLLGADSQWQGPEGRVAAHPAHGHTTQVAWLPVRWTFTCETGGAPASPSLERQTLCGDAQCVRGGGGAECHHQPAEPGRPTLRPGAPWRHEFEEVQVLYSLEDGRWVRAVALRSPGPAHPGPGPDGEPFTQPGGCSRWGPAQHAPPGALPVAGPRLERDLQSVTSGTGLGVSGPGVTHGVSPTEDQVGAHRGQVPLSGDPSTPSVGQHVTVRPSAGCGPSAEGMWELRAPGPGAHG